MASDAWKGLVFSLMAGDRNQEALEEIEKIPPTCASSSKPTSSSCRAKPASTSPLANTSHALEYITRVEDFYLLRRTTPPAGLEMQHAWLLYNVQDDHALYPVLLRLDARRDLTADQREQVETLWANWAVRRAFAAMDNGYLLRGVEILQAASEEYPDNMGVRSAVAGAYAKVGRSKMR